MVDRFDDVHVNSVPYRLSFVPLICLEQMHSTSSPIDASEFLCNLVRFISLGFCIISSLFRYSSKNLVTAV